MTLEVFATAGSDAGDSAGGGRGVASVALELKAAIGLVKRAVGGLIAGSSHALQKPLA